MALALSSRRSTMAAVASALAAMALAAAVAGRSCLMTEPGPADCVRDMVQAARAGDRDLVLELLGPATRERLDAEARRASDLADSEFYTARDMISIGSSQGIAEPVDVAVVDQRGDSAIVELVSPTTRSRIDLVRIAGKWRVELPAYRRP